MYLWNVKALARDLKEDKVTEKEQMKYYLLFSLLMSLVLSFPNSGSSHWGNPSLGWVDLGANLIITFFGILWCFEANKQGDNKNFVIRTVYRHKRVLLFVVEKLPIIRCRQRERVQGRLVTIAPGAGLGAAT